MKLETLALKWAITRKKTKLSAVEQKWTTALAPFDFDIKYRPGRCNGNADGLSRLHDAEYDANTILADTRATSVVPLDLRVAAMELVANADHLDEMAITTLPGISNADMKNCRETTPRTVGCDIIAIWEDNAQSKRRLQNQQML